VRERLEDLEEVEEPLLEEVLKRVDDKVTVGDLRVCEQRLVGKVSSCQ